MKTRGSTSPIEKTANRNMPYKAVDASAANINTPPKTGEIHALHPEANTTPKENAPHSEFILIHFGILKLFVFMCNIEKILAGVKRVIPKKISNIPPIFLKIGIMFEFINIELVEKVPPKRPAKPPNKTNTKVNPKENKIVFFSIILFFLELLCSNPMLPTMMGKVQGKKKVAIPAKKIERTDSSIILIR